jgi:hypothetical protein
MWFIADAWARSKGGHNAVQPHSGGDHYPSDNEIGQALIAGAILIAIGWVLFELYKMYRGARQLPRYGSTRTVRDR